MPKYTENVLHTTHTTRFCAKRVNKKHEIQKKRPDHELDLLKKLKIATKSKICIFAGGSTSECV